ncbi:MAG: hypothetical protein AB1861_08130 [Cyanobacteriota bacterium]
MTRIAQSVALLGVWGCDRVFGERMRSRLSADFRLIVKSLNL